MADLPSYSGDDDDQEPKAISGSITFTCESCGASATGATATETDGTRFDVRLPVHRPGCEALTFETWETELEQ